MRDKKYYIALDDFECKRGGMNCLNKMRNNLIANGKYTDVVNEVLLKVINATQTKFKMIYKEVRSWKRLFMMKRTVFGRNFKVITTLPI